MSNAMDVPLDPHSGACLRISIGPCLRSLMHTLQMAEAFKRVLAVISEQNCCPSDILGWPHLLELAAAMMSVCVGYA